MRTAAVVTIMKTTAVVRTAMTTAVGTLFLK